MTRVLTHKEIVGFYYRYFRLKADGFNNRVCTRVFLYFQIEIEGLKELPINKEFELLHLTYNPKRFIAPQDLDWFEDQAERTAYLFTHFKAYLKTRRPKTTIFN